MTKTKETVAYVVVCVYVLGYAFLSYAWLNAQTVTTIPIETYGHLRTLTVKTTTPDPLVEVICFDDIRFCAKPSDLKQLLRWSK